MSLRLGMSSQTFKAQTSQGKLIFSNGLAIAGLYYFLIRLTFTQYVPLS